LQRSQPRSETQNASALKNKDRMTIARTVEEIKERFLMNY